MPYGVLAVYGGLIVWTGLGVDALRRRRFGLFLAFGIGLLLFLNLRYFIEGPPASIAFFIAIYDVLDNLGLSAGGAEAMAACEGCSVWGDRFAFHPKWGVAFYDRFLNGSSLRTNLLYGHIGFNTIAFVLIHIQLWRPGHQVGSELWHRRLGRLTFLAMTLGVGCACVLATEHGEVAEYGAALSQYGFYFMSFCVYACMIMGVITIRRGDVGRHRVWMIRTAGAMWGAYWLFRVVLFFIDPLLRDVDTAAILIVIWGSAPAGALIAEAWRRSYDAAPGQARLSQTDVAPA